MRLMISAAALLALSGCLYIDDADHQQRVDLDGDGFTGDQDCNEGDASVHTEVELFQDLDGDGFGNATSTTSCGPLEGYTAAAGDCNDGSADAYPEAPELCDGIDNDCNGTAEDDDLVSWYLDADGDGFGAGDAVEACEAPSAAHVRTGGDCDDAQPAVNPGADERCTGIDDDCDGLVDQSDDSFQGDGDWYIDGDGDGFGNPADVVSGCAQDGRVPFAGDCDDTDAAVNPAAVEACTGVDDDCDGLVDVGAAGAVTTFADVDGDTYGDPATAETSCNPDSTRVSDDTDCDDAEALAFPGNPEVCDGVDNDCDGAVPANEVDDDGDGFRACEDCDDSDDSASELVLSYADIDLDGYGDPDSAVQTCGIPGDRVADGLDCDDGNHDIYPGAEELCNGIDDDCDGEFTVAEEDSDEDTFLPCAGPDQDCDDSDPTIHPGSHFTEVPHDGDDQDCDGKDVCTDLNCDGWADLVLASHNTGFPVQLAYGSSAGPTSSGALLLPAEYAGWTQVRDFDGDGFLDVLVSHHNDGDYETESRLWWGPNHDVWTALPTLGPMQVCVGDIDGSGHDDIVFTSYRNLLGYDTTAAVYYNDGTRFTTSTPQSLPTVSNLGCKLGDLNDDGYLDLVLSNWGDGGSGLSRDNTIYWGTSSGLSTVAAASVPGGSARAQAIDFGDVNGDGKLDILLSRNHTQDIRIWLQDSSDSYSSASYVEIEAGGSRQARFADLNGDGYDDVIAPAQSIATDHSWDIPSYVYWGGILGLQNSNRTLVPTLGLVDAIPFDIDQDGHMDLLTLSERIATPLVDPTNSQTFSYSRDAFIFWGDGVGLDTTSPTSLPTLGALTAAVYDFDEDGNMDIVIGQGLDGTGGYTSSVVYFGEDGGRTFDIGAPTSLGNSLRNAHITVVGR